MVAFDTLSAAKELQAAGFEQSQAEAVARTVVKLYAEHLATKADLYRVALYIIGANAAITFRYSDSTKQDHGSTASPGTHTQFLRPVRGSVNVAGSVAVRV